jgi:hypothetical protein
MADPQQPQFPPPHSWQPYPPPGPVTRRRRSRWLTVGLPVAGALVLIGAVAGTWFLVRGVAGSLGPAMETADSYATALVDQRWTDAHELLCEQNRTTVSPEALAEQYGDLAEFRIEGANVHSSGGTTTARVEIVFTAESGFRERTTLPMVQEDDTWRPCL